ncbi:cullin-1-like isoform X1 [Olea europaea subsp. europaea]|uniref:Cullin-1-like isoform X1 n=1 Tax=Olea europaea subsp. europaea TaxID=158383 RepID=A0A8S0TXM6_OLEEU|nr:cullin-1-like isoform X1 [Olea europaea subsp. europaea]
MARAASLKRDLSFEEAWTLLQEEAINKLIDNLEGVQKHELSSEEYMRFYTIVYNVCAPDQVGPKARKMYDHYKKTFEDYISSKVLPSLRGKKDESLLQELLRRWNNHKTMVRWLSRFFYYLERYFIVRKKLPSLERTSHLAFYNLVYTEINYQVRDAVISLIDREREGEQIDQATVKSVPDIYVETGKNTTKKISKSR